MRFKMHHVGWLLLAACLGCESSVPPGGTPTQLAAPAPPEPGRPKAAGTDQPADGAAPEGQAAAPEGQPATTDGAQPAAPAAAQPAPPAAAPAADAEGGELKKAEAGVGVKGKDYGGPGFITTPVMAKFSAEQRIAFEIQIPNAMKIYKAAHENKGPKSHEEFMEVIIKENGVPLPELAPGESYLYIPETEELMVKSPKAE
jgi:hypothetical protein